MCLLVVVSEYLHQTNSNIIILIHKKDSEIFVLDYFFLSRGIIFFQICDISKLKKIKIKIKIKIKKSVQEWELATWFCVSCANICVINLLSSVAHTKCEFGYGNGKG
jgi:hypothetical protein